MENTVMTLSTNQTSFHFKNARDVKNKKNKNTHTQTNNKYYPNKYNNKYLNMTSICAKTQIRLNEIFSSSFLKKKTVTFVTPPPTEKLITEGEWRQRLRLAWSASSAHQWHAAVTMLTPQTQKHLESNENHFHDDRCRLSCMCFVTISHQSWSMHLCRDVYI